MDLEELYELMFCSFGVLFDCENFLGVCYICEGYCCIIIYRCKGINEKIFLVGMYNYCVVIWRYFLEINGSVL